MCKFCYSFNSYKRARRISNGSLKNVVEDYEEIYEEYTVALVVKTWTKKRGKSKAGRTVDFRNRGKGYELNYCPECGRKLE